MRFIVCLILNLLACISVSADIKLPRVIGDGMVVQRGGTFTLWGWADPGERINIKVLKQQRLIKADKDGKWRAAFKSLPVGGPYEIRLVGKNTIVLNNVLSGDVWLASGQSNMEWPLQPPEGGRPVNNAEQEVATANFPNIRLFNVEHAIATSPQADVNADGWDAVTPQAIEEFSAVAYLFGRELHQQHQIPVGIIGSNWGGTVAEAWTSESGLRQLPDFINDLEQVTAPDAFSNFIKHKEMVKEWEHKYASVDRGMVANQAVWAKPSLDTSDWAKMNTTSWPVEELEGYSGTVWYQKEINISSDQVGRPLHLHFSRIIGSDTVYFNGREIGSSEDWQAIRHYKVPSELVKTGRNLITVRATGIKLNGKGYVGISGQASDIYAQIGKEIVPLSGAWRYKPSVDLSTYPKPVFLSNQPNVPTILYNGMIAPLVSYTIKGVIWYQGESNAKDHNRSAQYRTLFPALIKDWRQQWGYDFPFLFVQLAGFGSDKPEPAEYPWADLREAQTMALALPKTGMAVAVDIGEEHDIHPGNKQDVAHRLFLAAQKVAYGERTVHSGPMFESMNVEGNKIRIRFSETGSGLSIKGNDIFGFSVADKNNKFVWAKAVLDGNDILVFNQAVSNPVAARYNWGNTPKGNVYNKEGLPMVPFRTDNPAIN